LGTQIWEIDPEQAAMEVFKGSYSEFRGIKESRAAEKNQQTQKTVLRDDEAEEHPPKLSWKEQKRLEELEIQIAELERDLQILSSSLQKPVGDYQRVQEIGVRFSKKQKQLEDLMAEWEHLHSA
jgi:ATP-binding cassette subfamily F protein uup